MGLVAIITAEQKDSLIGQTYDGEGSAFNPFQDRAYNWLISEKEVELCVNPLFPWVCDLALTEYQDYAEEDISEINYIFADDQLLIFVFNDRIDPKKSVVVSTLSQPRQDTVGALRTLVLSTVDDCTQVDFTRRGGIIKQYSPTQGIVTLILPDLSAEDQAKYNAVGDMCEELKAE